MYGGIYAMGDGIVKIFLAKLAKLCYNTYVQLNNIIILARKDRT